MRDPDDDLAALRARVYGRHPDAVAVDELRRRLQRSTSRWKVSPLDGGPALAVLCGIGGLVTVTLIVSGAMLLRPGGGPARPDAEGSTTTSAGLQPRATSPGSGDTVVIDPTTGRIITSRQP